MRSVLATVVIGVWAAQAAEPVSLQASNGAVVLAPEIGQLDCPQMMQVLHNLDQTQYRAAAPLEPGDPDWPIFAYEDALAAAHYARCTVGYNRLTDPLDAFSRGFDSP